MATPADLGEPVELKIPVVYGHIAAKQWGPKTGVKVLAFHGWLDNACSFDNLAKVLPSNWNIVAFDQPGNGRSSYLPLGCHYNVQQILVDIQRVVKFLQWDYYHFISHSYGGRFAILYACIYPKEVGAVVMLDYMYPGFRLEPFTTIDVATKNLLAAEASLKSRRTTWEKTKLLELFAYERGLPVDAALPMFERSIAVGQDGRVGLSVDPRLKVYFPECLTNPEELLEMLRRQPLNVLVIDYTKSNILRHKKFADLQMKTKKTLNANDGNFQLVEIEGHHFDHVINPAASATPIADFIDQLRFA